MSSQNLYFIYRSYKNHFQVTTYFSLLGFSVDSSYPYKRVGSMYDMKTKMFVWVARIVFVKLNDMNIKIYKLQRKIKIFVLRGVRCSKK